MPYTSLFGPILSREQVEKQTISLLQTPPSGSTFPLIVYYLAEIERQLGLPAKTIVVPPGASSYRGGIDWNLFMPEWAPQLTVLAQPTGTAERYAAGRYQQWYELQVGALVTGGDEDAARLLADRYGAAIAACVAQNGGLGSRTDWDTGSTVPFAEETHLVAAPRTEFLDAMDRRVVRAVAVFNTLVEQVVDSGQGPRGFKAFGSDPYTNPGLWPTVQTVQVTVASTDPLNNTAPATGKSQVTPDGKVTVTE